jgi:hypothetical protein
MSLRREKRLRIILMTLHIQARLVLGWSDSRPIHVVVADNVDDQENIVITVYEPDLTEWERDFKRRKRS